MKEKATSFLTVMGCVFLLLFLLSVLSMLNTTFFSDAFISFDQRKHNEQIARNITNN